MINLSGLEINVCRSKNTASITSSMPSWPSLWSASWTEEKHGVSLQTLLVLLSVDSELIVRSGAGVSSLAKGCRLLRMAARS